VNVPHTVLQLDANKLAQLVGYEPLRPGIDILYLYQEEASGSSCALLKYQPGAEVPEHVHQGFEHVYVLAGEQSDERGNYRQGSFVINPPGTTHRVWSKDGCLVLIVWQRPVAFKSGSVAG
jgi:anti-sigma factor ChrR (cupin superfamily)